MNETVGSLPKSVNLAIVGSRSFTNYDAFKSELEKVLASKNLNPAKIISGGAAGVDSLAKRWADDNSIPVLEIKPNWKLGKGAGIIRNRQIIESCDVCIAFWDFESKGTKNAIDVCRKFNKHYFVINTAKL